MEISYNGKTIPVDCAPGDRLKLYSVPVEYSEDGLYLAQWRHGEAEPVPACLGSDAEPLADITVGTEGVISGYLAQGVIYA